MHSALRKFWIKLNQLKLQVRNSGYSVPIRPSRWVYDKFKDDVHFYLAIMGIPLRTVITLTNLFYSNAQLSAIPEDYNPKEWEYYPNPITRFITRYFKVGYQEVYEVHLHNIWEAAKVSEMRQLKNEVKRQMAIEGDYKGWYHRADIAHYSRQRRQMQEEMTDTRGHGTSWH